VARWRFFGELAVLPRRTFAALDKPGFLRSAYREHSSRARRTRCALAFKISCAAFQTLCFHSRRHANLKLSLADRG